MTVRGLVLVEARHAELCERPEPRAEAGAVVIAPRVTGICGSDLHLYREGHIGDSIVREPHVLGHETAGVVVEVGPGVEEPRVGDRVLIEPGLACLACHYCLTGRYNICPNARFLGVPPTPGTLADLVAVPARWVHRLPDGVTFATAALIEPFAVGLQAAKEAGVSVGQSVVMLGAGPIGLMILLAARLRGAGPVISVDLSPVARAMVQQFGADLVIDPRAVDPVDAIREATGGGADVVIEAAGRSRGDGHAPLHVRRVTRGARLRRRQQERRRQVPGHQRGCAADD
ncbi:MAG: alcohol dehydrogenase catalytic domain-containing protein [Chloroflexi bacterium]|nr:alcohol dehydrogenase catalytic domain-containing protein [Chloroflexota bacterium]